MPNTLSARRLTSWMSSLALTGGENQLAIWTAFARRGIGFSARDGETADSTSVTEAFDLPQLGGDFNGDLAHDCHDIDLLGAGIVAGSNDPQLDLTGDGLVDLSDRDAWLSLAGAVNLPSGSASTWGRQPGWSSGCARLEHPCVELADGN